MEKETLIKSIPKKHFYIFIVIAVLLILGLLAHLKIEYEIIKEDAVKELINFSNYKEGEILTFISEEKYKLKLLLSSSFFYNELTSVFRDNSKLDQFVKTLHQIKSIKDLENVVLIDSMGKIIHDFNVQADIFDSLTLKIVKSKISNDPFIDIFESKGSGIVYSFQFPVIENKNGNQNLLGFIRFQYDASTYLIPRIEYLEPFSTREILLVKHDKESIIYLSYLRKVSLRSTSLKEVVAGRICFDDVFGPKGYCKYEGLDYAGTPVVGVFNKIEGTNLILFTKQDQTEIFKSFNSYTVLVSLSLFLFLVSSGFGFGFWSYRMNLKMKEKELELLRQKSSLETQYEALIESMNDALLIINQDGYIVNVNSKVKEIYGYDKEELISKRIDFVCIENIEQLRNRFMEIINSNGYIYETSHRKKNGECFDVEVSARALKINGNQLILGVVRDISERKLNYIKLSRQLEFQKFLTLIASKINSINISNFEDELENVLEFAGNFLRVDRIKIFLKDDKTGLYNCKAEWCESGVPRMKETLQFLDLENDFKYLFSNLNKSGTIKINDISQIPSDAINELKEIQRQGIKSVFWKSLKITNELIGFLSINSVKREIKWSDEIEAFVNIFSDLLVNVVTRVSFEKKLNEQEIKLQRLIENSSEVILVLDSSLKNKFISSSVKNVIGYTVEERLGRSALELIHEDDLKKVGDIMEQVKSHGAKAQFTIRVKHKRGDYIWIEGHIINLLDDPIIEGYVINYHDITDLKDAYLKLQESEERYRLIAEETQTVIYKLNYSTMKYDFMSPIIKELIGFTPAEIDEIGFSKIIRRIEFLKKPNATLAEIIRDRILGETGEYLADYLIETKDGKMKWIRDHSFPIFDRDDKLYGSIGTLSDVTEIKLKEEEIIKRQKYLSTLVDIQKQLIFLQDLNKFYNYMLSKLGEVSGASRVYIFENHLDENGRLLMSQKAEWCLKGVTPQIDNPELQNLPYDELGYDLICDFKQIGYLNKIVNTLPEPVKSILLDQDIKSILLIPINIHDEFFGFIGFDECFVEKIWDNIEIEILQSAASSIALAIEAMRKNNEILRARDEAIEANRLKSHFLSLMSHEIRTPLNSIIGYTELLKELYYDNDNEEVKKYFDSIFRGSERLLHTINQIIEISRLEAGGVTINLKTLDLKKYINEVLQILEINAKDKNLNLKLNLPADDLNIFADEFCVHGILENIISNSIKYSSKGTIEVSAEIKDTWIEVVVRDEGEGISEEYLKHIFKPFSQEDMSYKRKYEGTGLGLAITKHYLDLIGGEIFIQSKKGEGTTVTLRFKK